MRRVGRCAGRMRRMPGSVGEKDLGIRAGRAALAKWLVDCVEGTQDVWVGKMPAVSTANGKKSAWGPQKIEII
jgi:hypothetical protein